MGLGHAVLMARELVGDEPFAVILADDIIDAKVPCLKQMVEVLQRNRDARCWRRRWSKAKLSLRMACLMRSRFPGKWNGRLFEVQNLVEKPKVGGCAFELGNHWAVHSDTRQFLRCWVPTELGAGGELQLTDGLKQLLKKEKIYGFTFEGKRHDTGDKLGFLKATVEFALKREDLGGEFREYLKTLEL